MAQELSSPRALTAPCCSTTIRAPSGALVPVRNPSPTNPRHMDVYPSRNADSREHRVPALQNKSNACGDRLRSADAFH